MWWYKYAIRDPYADTLVILWLTAYDQIDADEQIRRMTEHDPYLAIEMMRRSADPPPHKRKELAKTYRRRPEIEFNIDEVPF